MKNANISVAIIINIFITLTEVIIGFAIGSLALISDAVHNFFDVGTLGLSWWGEKVKEKAPDQQKTYGYKRAEIIIALFNSLILIAAVIFIFYEAVGRFFHPSKIKSSAMIIAAAIALFGNGIATYFLEKDAHKNLNLKSAWLHSLQDALFSLGVILGAVIIYYTDWFVLDPAISIFLSIYIFKEAYKLVKQTVNILMESIPSDIDFEKVKNALKNLKGVKDVNDLHIWQTDSSGRFLSVHLEIENLENEKRNELFCLIQRGLKENFKINHSTIQMISANEQEKLKLKCNHCN